MSNREVTAPDHNDADLNLEVRKALYSSGHRPSPKRATSLISMRKTSAARYVADQSSGRELLTHKIGMRGTLATFRGSNPYARPSGMRGLLLRRLVYVLTENGGFKEFQWTTVAEYVPSDQRAGRVYVKIRLNEELGPPPFCF